MKFPFAIAAAAAFVLSAQELRAQPEPPFPSFVTTCEQRIDIRTDRRTEWFATPAEGILWPAWNAMMNVRWGQADLARGRLFNAEAVKHAFAALPSPDAVTPYHYGSPSTKAHYASPAALPAQIIDYEEAARAYYGAQWDDAIARFDRIAADRTNPYRAAAAYSAARAALYAGRLDEGTDRIEAIVADTSLAEFHLAAYQLIGAYGWGRNSASLIAGRFADIRHILTAPPSITCASLENQKVFSDAGQDLDAILRTAFYGVPWSGARRQALDALAKTDPWFDVLRIIAAPTSYDRNFDWFEDPVNTGLGRVRNPDRADSRDLRQDIASDAAALTAHARERWLATHNPLWGYALAKRTGDAADLALLQDMLARLDGLPPTPEMVSAKPALQWHYVRHAVRLLLMQNRLDDALTFLRRTPLEQPSYATINSSGRTLTGRLDRTSDAILTGGTLLFLSRLDMESAKRWALEAPTALQTPRRLFSSRPPTTWIFAERFDQIHSRPGNYFDVLRTRQFMDLLPAERLVAMSKDSNWSANEKREFIGAGWIRLYMLERWERVWQVLPDIRAAYPELAGDIDRINAAWTETERRRLLTHMLLRTPGLSPRLIWQRHRNYGQRAEDIFTIDAQAANDGNWWCPLDVDDMKLQIASALNSVTRESQYTDLARYASGRVYYRNYPEQVAPLRRRLLELADRMIAWHPLLKDVDLAELDALAKATNGPRRLSEEAISWAKDPGLLAQLTGADRLIPETLHLAVRSTRWGCRRQGGHGEYSRAAYVLLHASYADSEWAKKTPYWFNDPSRLNPRRPRR